MSVHCVVGGWSSEESTRLALKSITDDSWVGMSLINNHRWEHYYKGYRGSTIFDSQTQLPSQKGTNSAQEAPKSMKVHSTCVR